MYIYITCVYIYRYINTCMHACMQTDKQTDRQTDVHTHIYIRRCIYNIYTQMHLLNFRNRCRGRVLMTGSGSVQSPLSPRPSPDSQDLI